MEFHQPQSRRRSRARERYASRVTRQTTPTGGYGELDAFAPLSRGERYNRYRVPVTGGGLRERIELLARDAWWYTLHRPYVVQAIVVLLVVLFLLFVVSHVANGRLFPNVWTMGIQLGGMTAEEAEQTLRTAWNNEVVIQLADGERVLSVRPGELGLLLDTGATVERARGVGMAGIPMGYSVVPVVTLDEFAAQSYLLDLTGQVNSAPFNAGYRWEGDELVGVPGRAGRVLDVGMTMEYLKTHTASVADKRRLDLVTMPLEPEITDPQPYLAAARALAIQPFEMVGYDPFLDEMLAWQTDRDTFTSWLEASNNGLTLRKDVFAKFLEAQNATLAVTDATRYLEPTETMGKMADAINAGQTSVLLRIRYRPTQYEIRPGDTGYEIAGALGVPFYVLTTVNPGLEWEALTVGDTINLPSRDVTMPLDPVPGKRIIVNLDDQTLTAYENGQQVFNWYISSGIADFPTAPGVYQILDHNEVAFGSTFELCSSSGCGQWEMYWFMGVYEVIPGLMNGFHGAVLLPNGAYLGGGNVGWPYTYGCIMSENGNAQLLYNWADDGTVVEIISSDYPPVSELGRLSLQHASAGASDHA